MVGSPGSGKSTYSEMLKSQFTNSTIIHSDTYKSNFNVIEKHIINALQDISTKNSILIYDATNGTRERRAKLLSLAKTFNIPTLIIHILNHGENRNKLRENNVPQIVYNKFWSTFENPDPKDEGMILEII